MSSIAVLLIVHLSEKGLMFLGESACVSEVKIEIVFLLSFRFLFCFTVIC